MQHCRDWSPAGRGRLRQRAVAAVPVVGVDRQGGGRLLGRAEGRRRAHPPAHGVLDRLGRRRALRGRVRDARRHRHFLVRGRRGLGHRRHPLFGNGPEKALDLWLAERLCRRPGRCRRPDERFVHGVQHGSQRSGRPRLLLGVFRTHLQRVGLYLGDLGREQGDAQRGGAAVRRAPAAAEPVAPLPRQPRRRRGPGGRVGAAPVHPRELGDISGPIRGRGGGRGRGQKGVSDSAEGDRLGHLARIARSDPRLAVGGRVRRGGRGRHGYHHEGGVRVRAAGVRVQSIACCHGSDHARDRPRQQWRD
mmetsp:Transcript_71622/g.219346  ORF Transcript_71622/g.219346 Transcript_71622/m.219346 type:complete len:305 (-) Transcript_71622:424-1338(-)